MEESMKVKICNFGPIQNFECDLSKNIIAIYGNNNIGKSYSMQIIYLLLKSIINCSPRIIRYNISKDNVKCIEDTISAFKKSEYVQREITDEINSWIENILTDNLGDNFLSSLKNSFPSYNSALREDSCIILEYECFSMRYLLRNEKFVIKNEEKSNQKFYLKETSSSYHKTRQIHEGRVVYVDKNNERNSDQVYSTVLQILFYQIDKVLICAQKDVSNIFFFPASRSGIYNGMSAFAPIVAELAKSKSFFTKKIEFPGLTEPISDYFIALSSINEKSNQEFEDVYNELEKEILKGEILIDKKDSALLYKNQDNLQFRMTEVSSMVSEIAPIVAFLKFIINARRNRVLYIDNRIFFNGKLGNGQTIVFIEEPEAHLHPSNQIKLIEILAQLLQKNVKIVFSSHSNYIFNKLNNMILSKQMDYKLYEPILIMQEENGSKSTIMQIDQTGVIDDNFSDTAFQLYEERENILEALNQEE